MIETFEDMKNIPITSMTIGDILKYFEVIAERKHGGDEDVKRSVSEVASRFMAEAMYKYYNHKDSNSETSNTLNSETSDAPACEEKEEWSKNIGGPFYFYTRDVRVTIVKVLTDEFKDRLYACNFGTNNINYSFENEKYPNCELSIYLDMDYNLHITYQIGDTFYRRSVPVELSDIEDDTSNGFWGRYGRIILSLSNELIEQIQEGH